MELTQEEALERILDTVRAGGSGEAPFALVLGSGFSYGLVPTVEEIISKSLPLWIHCGQNRQRFEAFDPTPEESREIARRFWEAFSKKNARLQLELDPTSGLPADFSDAYRVAFDPNYAGAVGLPKHAREFQRALVRLDQPRLNAAHFLLASILGSQPGQQGKGRLFQHESAFSRLILTTNFDPFLQVALQAVNQLYIMSDSPELGIEDEIMDDQTAAVHLVYVHGSIHRQTQIASPEQIEGIKKRNRQALAGPLQKRGAIVLGYAGWDDAIVDALAACPKFDYGLYWFGRSDSASPNAFGPRVRSEILTKATTFYVRIESAGDFLAGLFRGLVKGSPRLLDNPIDQIRELLQGIDLGELERKAAPPTKEEGIAAALTPAAQNPFSEARRFALAGLDRAEAQFRLPQAEEVGSKAELASSLGNFPESIRLFSEALKLDGLPPAVKANLLAGRALAHYYALELSSAQDDWGAIVELRSAPAEQVARALVNRAVVYGQQGEAEKALADYGRAIEVPGAPAELVARALVYRGVAYRQQGELEKALADYGRAIEMPGASAEQVGKALFNRAIVYGQQGKAEKALVDYGRVVEVPGAPAEQVASALVNRGVAYSQKGEAGKALADYGRVIEMPGVPAEPVAKALVNRGVLYGQQGELEKALADFGRVIEMPGVPAELVASALVNRGVAYRQQGELEKALADYGRAIEMPGAPAEQVARALVNRGALYGQQGESEKALADCVRVIEMPGAPAELVASVLFNRGVVHGQRGELEKELADYGRAIERPGAPAEQLARALFNRGATYGQQGELEKALADYGRLIEMPGVPAEQVASALVNRGVAYSQKGEAGKALADYGRVIEMPGAPTDQIARALLNRGWNSYTAGHFEAFLHDTRSALEHDPNSHANVNLGLAELATHHDDRAREAYSEAARRFPQSIPEMLKDLEEAQKTWLTAERAQPILALLNAV